MQTFNQIPNNSQTISPQLDNVVVQRVLEKDAKLHQSVVNNAFIQLREKPYAVKNRKLYVMASITGVFFQLLSVAVSIVFGAELILSLSNEIPTVAGYVISVLLLMFLEALKRIMVDDAAEAYFIYKEKSPSIFVLIVLVALSGIASVGGAYNLAHDKTADAITAGKVDENAATADIDADIKADRERIQDIKRTHSWQKKLTPEGIRLTKQIENRIDKLTTQKEAKLNHAISTNENLELKAASKGASAGWGAAIFAAMIELIILASITYTVFYHVKVKDDSAQVAAFGTPQKVGFPTPSKVAASHTSMETEVPEIPEARKMIGFGCSWEKPENVEISHNPIEISHNMQPSTSPLTEISVPTNEISYFTWKGICDKEAMMRHRKKTRTVTQATYAKNNALIQKAKKEFTKQTEMEF